MEKVWEKIWRDGYEKVTFFYDKASNTKAIISVHNTNLGPALGGTRIYPYATTSEALHDVLRLSKGMTYKAAVANLPLGGGKSVIQADPKTDKSRAMLEAHGRFVDSLKGMYITAEDSGTTREDIDIIRGQTPYVVGTSEEKGGSGDPSPYTARGVLVSMQACAERVLNKSLGDCKIAVQGVGNVGRHLATMLKELGAKLYITDVDEEKVKKLCDQLGATPCSLQEIVSVECDIFSPNALGGVLDADNINRLKCPVIAGAANNQLANKEAGELLHSKNIFYAPDYVINAGGLISVCCEWLKYDNQKRDELIDRIGDTMAEIIDESQRQKQPTHAIADKVAESRFLKSI